MLLLYSIVAGALVGRLRGGSLAALADSHFRWWGLALAGLGFQVLLFSGPLAEGVGGAGPALYLASSLAVFAALLVNVRLPGFPIIAAGAALNLVTIAVNGGYMPSAPAAWAQLRGVAALPATAFTNSSLIGPHTLLPFLGDIFVLPRPIPFANVFSIGDVLIGLGSIVFLVRAMRQPDDLPQAARPEGSAPVVSAAPGARR